MSAILIQTYTNSVSGIIVRPIFIFHKGEWTSIVTSVLILPQVKPY